MPRSKNVHGRRFDAYNFISREANDNFLLGRPVQQCRFVNTLNFDCVELLDQLTLMGWDLLVQNSRPFYPDLIRTFYANASFDPTHSTINSRYRGRDFAITPMLLNTVLNIPNNGVAYYQTNSWSFPEFSEEVLRTLLLCEDANSNEDCAYLSFPHRLAHLLLTKIILPRDGHHTSVQKMDLFLLYHLFEGARVNLGYIIIRHMAAAITHTSRSLPYGSLLTALLEFLEFDLSGVRPMKLPSVISTATFSSLGFRQNRYGEWVRKHIVDSPSDHDDDSPPYVPSPRHDSPPPFEPPPVPPPTDSSYRFDQIDARLDTLQSQISDVQSFMYSTFGPSSAFYAAYGPHADRPSSSTMPPPGDDDDDDGDDDDDDGDDDDDDGDDDDD